MPRYRKYPDELLLANLPSAESFSDLIRRCGGKPNAGTIKDIRRRLTVAGIDFSHLKGAAWARGRKVTRRKRPDCEIFACPSTISNRCLIKRLLKMGWKFECSMPGCPSIGFGLWLGKPIAVHLDHKNGFSLDNRLENLRFLCIVCHQHTDTYGTKNRRFKHAPKRAAAGAVPAIELCPSCNGTKGRGSTQCHNCVDRIKNLKGVRAFKVNWPSDETLLLWRATESLQKIADRIGVFKSSVSRKVKKILTTRAATALPVNSGVVDSRQTGFPKA